MRERDIEKLLAAEVRKRHGLCQEFRRVAIRYDKLASRFLSFVHLACIRILLA